MRIGELAERLGLNPKTLRYYESIGLLPEPPRTPAGYRDYEAADLERLAFIRSAQRLGLRLDEIREVLGLRERGQRPCDYVLGVVDRQLADIDRRITELEQLRGELVGLQRLAARLPPGTGSFCGVIEHARPSVPHRGGRARRAAGPAT
ncbi:MAG: heavy metal-responsive transcriptional regulator [Acidimicrobiales bacterium]